MEGFKVPSTLPQDLLLIQEFVDIPENTVKVSKFSSKSEDEDIASSCSESESESGDDSEEAMDSEDEVAANLTRGAATSEDDELMKEPATYGLLSFLTASSALTYLAYRSEPSASSSESSDDDHDAKEHLLDIDDDEDPIQMPSNSYLTTKNEIVEEDVAVPELEHVGTDEVLEKVGEIMTIVDQVVIVRGLPSEYLSRASERALDSDTLLVFDDRKVMGYVRYRLFFFRKHPLINCRADLRNIWPDSSTSVPSQVQYSLSAQS
jgi:H/ACA ribonucleoprotein complex non-core subunit NAF1